jgi:methionyl-tRNA synthetase
MAIHISATRWSSSRRTCFARHRRLRGDDVRFLSGTDDNALKNVDAALVAGLPVAEFVSEKAQRFADLAAPLQLSNDDFIRTSTDPRHRPGVERLWAACTAAGDLYQRDYEGLTAPAARRSSFPQSCTMAFARSTMRRRS